jgi:hypothetical protein
VEGIGRGSVEILSQNFPGGNRDNQKNVLKDITDWPRIWMN